MTTLREAATQALEALGHYATDETPEGWHAIAAITALKAALAAPPAAWAYKDSGRICDNKDGRLTAPEGWRPLYD